MKFETGQRVEFTARDRVIIGTVVEYKGAPAINKEVVVVQVKGEGGYWAMHPDSLRLVEDV